MSTQERPTRQAGFMVDRSMLIAGAANIVGLLGLIGLPILQGILQADGKEHDIKRGDMAELLDALGGFGAWAVTLPIFTFIIASVVALLPMAIPYRKLIVGVLSLLGLYQIVGLMVTNNQNDLGLGIGDLGLGTWIVILASIVGGVAALGSRSNN